MRTFNTAEPCDPQRHYMLPAEPRVPAARHIIDAGEYFVIRAPRQAGKTTVLRSLARAVNADGKQAAVTFSAGGLAAFGDDVDGAMEALISAITAAARGQLLRPEQLPPSPWPQGPAGDRMRKGLDGAGPARCRWQDAGDHRVPAA